MKRNQIRIGEVLLSLDEAQETLSAIRSGQIDAVVVESLRGHEIYAFRDPSHPYRLLIEAMGEGAVLATIEGVICYQNPRFEQLVGNGVPLQGRSLTELVLPADRPELGALLEQARTSGGAQANVMLIGRDTRPLPVKLSLRRALLVDVAVLCVIITDLTEQRRQEELYRTAR